MKCSDKLPLSKEEQEALNKAVFDILCNGLDIVRKRFPKFSDLDGDNIELPKEDEDINPFSLKP